MKALVVLALVEGLAVDSVVLGQGLDVLGDFLGDSVEGGLLDFVGVGKSLSEFFVWWVFSSQGGTSL